MALIFTFAFLLASAAFTIGTDVDKEWLTGVLKNADKDGGLKRIISMETYSADENGTTFGWESTRVEMKMETNTGRVLPGSLIVISLPSTEYREKQINDTGLFKTDISMYRLIIPAMDDLLLEYTDNGERIWITAFGFDKYEKYILEDVVKESGYERRDKIEGLDFNHCKSAMKHLGKFHALSAVLHEMGKIPVHEFDLSLLQRNKDKIKNFYEIIFNNFAHSIEEKWGPEWSSAAQKIKEKAKTVTDDLLEIYKRNESSFNVINHGSYYIGNLLFKYGLSDVEMFDVPLAMKVEGFQMAFYNSPVFDLQFFINTSPNVEVMTTKRDELLKAYHGSLVRYLKMYEFQGEKPSFEDILGEMTRTDFFGLATAINQLVYMYLKPEELPDLEKLVRESWEKNQVLVDTAGMFSPKYIANMKKILNVALDKNVI